MSTTINNLASVIYSFTGSSDTDTVVSNELPITLENSQNITVTKTANPTVFSSGDIITYSVVITNTGPFFLTGVRIIDNLGSGNLAYVIGSARLTTSGGTYSVSPTATNPLTFTLQQLNVGQTMTLTYNCQVVFNIPSSLTTITNTVEAIGYTSTSSNSAFDNCTIQKKNVSILNVTKSATKSTVYPNENFSYIITINNNNSLQANIASITDQLPSNFVVTSITLKIGTSATTTLLTSDYTLSMGNNLVVPSSTGPSITALANGTTILTINGYFTV